MTDDTISVTGATAPAVPGSDEHTTAAAARTAELALKPADAPAARPVVYVVSAVLAGLAVVGVHDLLVRADALGRPEWVPAALEWISGLDWVSMALPVAIVAFIVALLLLIVAFKPRRSVGMRGASASATWFRPVDVARLCSQSARRIPGVLSASSSATSRKVTVTATTADGDQAAVEEAIRSQVASLLDGTLREPPTVQVRVNRATIDEAREGDR